MERKRKHTLADVRKVMRELDKKTGKSYASLPMRVSKRMTRALATSVYTYSYNRINGIQFNFRAHSFKFSYFFLNSELTEREFKLVLIHEYLHQYTNETEDKDCMHNNKFKANCKKFGVEEVGGVYCSKEIGNAFAEAKSLYKKGLL